LQLYEQIQLNKHNSTKETNLLDQDVYGIEIEICLKRHVGENEERKYIEMEARLPGRVAQEFEVQAGGSELGRGRDGGTQAGIRCLRRRKKRWRESYERRRFRTGPYTGVENGGREKG
jgi:hypothetical protein